MATFKLTFPYKGRWPGDVVEVRDDEVRDLVQSGIGHLEGAEPVLRLGRLPEVVQPPKPRTRPLRPRRSPSSAGARPRPTSRTRRPR
ncbi:hypothetical protein SAV14893_050640 [Streptomyces avermitilis]|uniref:Uncharacterized protein n=1 Tax=Streptomyces avermitilis TaxID=33903 RepID=A0A4D4LVP3_STRAX|nr:hypothetical protein SAV14893_050640 [Streptomyces avermitilis]GDY74111.1 hypothetical protein SAV31267_035960 [Streptomyces avermitilis]